MKGEKRWREKSNTASQIFCKYKLFNLRDVKLRKSDVEERAFHKQGAIAESRYFKVEGT